MGEKVALILQEGFWFPDTSFQNNNSFNHPVSKINNNLLSILINLLNKHKTRFDIIINIDRC